MKWPGKYPSKTWKVRSRTNPNQFYRVELWVNEFVCDCMYSYYKRKECAHIRAVKNLLATKANEVQNAKEAPQA